MTPLPGGQAIPPGDGPIEVERDTYRAKWDIDGLNFTSAGKDKSAAEKSIAVRLMEIRSGQQKLIAPGAVRTSPKREANTDRVRYTLSSNITEEYVALDFGVEQLFVVQDFPALDGDIEIVVQLKGQGTSLHREKANDIWILDKDGQPTFRYIKPIAYDATGWACPLEMRVEGDNAVIVVPSDWLSKAAYPVTIDPIIKYFDIDEPTNSQQQPAVAYDSTTNNRYLAVWREYVDNGYKIYGRLVYANGTVGTAFEITGTGTYDPEPEVVFNPKQNEYLIVWANSNEGRVWARRLSQNGEMLGSWIDVTGGSVSNPRLATVACDTQTGTGTGDYLVAWSQGTTPEVFVRLVTGTGALGTMYNLSNDSTDDDSWARVVYNKAANEFMVVWNSLRDNNTWGIYGYRVSASGVPTGTLLTIRSGAEHQFRPDIAYNDREQQYLVVWLDSDSAQSYINVRGRRLSSTGSVIDGSDITISVAGVQYHYTPRVEYHHAGNEYLVVWEQGTVPPASRCSAGTDYNIYGEGWTKRSWLRSGYDLVTKKRNQLGPGMRSGT